MAKSVTVEASATTKAPLFLASKVITDPDNIPKWFKGARDVEAKRFPERGGTLKWKVGGKKVAWDFTGRILENELPRRLMMRVETRGSQSHVSHLFDGDDSGTKYTKRVVAEGSWMYRLLLRSVLPRSVKREVRAAARLADEAHEAKVRRGK